MARESQPARTGLTLAINKDIWRANFYRFCQLLEQENPDVPKLGTTSHPGDDRYDSDHGLVWVFRSVP